MSCDHVVAIATALLGFTPQPGTVVNVPAHYVARASYAEKYQAKACARKMGIRWRIVESGR